MRKVLSFMFLNIILILGIPSVKAATISLGVSAECSFSNNQASKNATETCKIKINPSTTITNKYVVIPVQLSNLTLTDHLDAEGWTFVDQGNNRYSITPTSKTINPGEQVVTTLTFTKVQYEAICALIIDSPYLATIPNEPEPQKHTCEQVDDKYYDKNGNIVDEADYRKDCLSCKKQPDGTFTGKDGNTVTEDQYNIECKKHTCEKVGDQYFDSNGNVVDESTYRSDCLSCKKQPDGTYTGKNGNTVTEEQYNIECKKHSCDKVGDHYFDPNGKEITKEEYDKLCPNGPNPGTGTSLPLATLALLFVAGVGLVIIANRTNKFN